MRTKNDHLYRNQYRFSRTSRELCNLGTFNRGFNTTIQPYSQHPHEPEGLPPIMKRKLANNKLYRKNRDGNIFIKRTRTTYPRSRNHHLGRQQPDTHTSEASTTQKATRGYRVRKLTFVSHDRATLFRNIFDGCLFFPQSRSPHLPVAYPQFFVIHAWRIHHLQGKL